MRLFRLRAAAALFCIAAAAPPQGGSVEAPVLPVWVTLGTTGGPVANPSRSQPANAALIGHDILLFDTGDGAVGRLAAAGYRLDNVRAVFLSHLHLDHTAGLQAVIGLRWMNGMNGPFRIYGPPGTKALVDGIVASMRPAQEVGFGLRSGFGSFAIEVNVVEIGPSAPMTILPGITVAAIANSHYSEDAADSGTGGFVSLSYRLDANGRSIVYTGDTGPSAEVTRFAHGADMLVSEVQDLPRLEALIRRTAPNMPPAMFAGLMEHLRLHHLSPEDVGRMAQAAGVRQVVLTHMVPGPPGAEADAMFIPRVRAHYSGPVTVAADLQRHNLTQQAGEAPSAPRPR